MRKIGSIAQCRPVMRPVSPAYLFTPGCWLALSTGLIVLSLLGSVPTKAQVNWSDGNGNWNVPSNWSDNAVPGPSDGVSILLPDTVTIDSAVPNILYLTLRASGGTLQILTGGSLSVSDSITIGGGTGFGGAILVQGAGASLTTSATIVMEGGSFTVQNGGVVNGALQTLFSGNSILVQGTGSMWNAASSQIQSDAGITVSQGGTLNLGQTTVTSALVALNVGLGGSDSGGTITASGPISYNTPSGQLTVDFNHTGVVVFSPSLQQVNGTISVNVMYSGTTILTGNSSYTGGTSISGGTLQLGNGGTNGSITGNVTDNGVFAIDRSDTYNFSGNISGTGAFQQMGTGTVILSGDNSYSGTTTISSGTLEAGSSTALSSSSDVVVDGTLDLHGFNAAIASLTGTGTVTNDGATGAILTLGGDNTSTTFSGRLVNGNGSIGLDKTGTGTLILTGNNQYTGGTTITGGGLQIGNGSTTGSITGNVTDNGVLAFDRSDNYTFGGAITGTGSLEVEDGTVILTGNNTYKGGTTIDRGTLQIGNGGPKGSITGRVTDNGSLVFDLNDAYNFNQAISGRGAVEQSGTGTLTLSGTNTYSGGTTIQSGTLVADSAQALGTGNVTLNGGVLTADPQPINVVGNYFQGPNGTLQLTIAGASAGQYDYLNVTGNASLGGTLKLINQNFTPVVGDTLTLVRSGGAITSKFATFIDPFTTRAGLNTIDLVYSLHSVDLEFLNIVSVPPSSPPPVSPLPPSTITTINFGSFAKTPNELAAGELLDAIELNSRAGDLINFFLGQSFTNIPGDLAIIAPESLTAFYEISFSAANIQRLTLENRFDDLRAGLGSLNQAPTEGGTVGLQKSSGDGKTFKNPVEPVLEPVRQPFFDLWASGFGDFVNVDSDYNARGYRFTTSGFDLGFDYRFLDHFAIGVMGNYAYTWTDLRPGTITVNSGRGGLYAGYFAGGYYLNAGVYGGYNTYDTNRRGLGGNAIGNTDGKEWSGFLSTGYDFHHGDLTVGPIASVQYTDVYINSFSETGSLVPMNIHSGSEESLRSDLGFRTFYQFHASKVVVAPYLKASWEHEFKYSALPITAGLAEFPGPDETFTGPAEGHDSAIVSTGVSVHWTPMISTYVGYDGQLGRGRYDSNAVTGGVRISW